MSEPDVETAAYSRWLNTILEKHAKQLWDTADGDVDDAQLDEDWEVLPGRLRRRLWGLSADLFSLVDNEKFTDADWEPISQQELPKLLARAFRNRQWDDLLELLRRPPRSFPSDQVSYIRGRAWQELGQHHVALKFFDNAFRLKPGHAPYLILALECLKASGAWQEAINRANQYGLDPVSPPALLFRAGDVFYTYSMTRVGNQEELAQRAIDLINQGFDRLAIPGTEPPLDSALAAAYLTKAYCLEQLGQANESLSTYDAAIQRFPTNPELLTARGLFRLEHQIGTPIDDFQEAVQWSARSVWPYLELARHYYYQHDYKQTIDLCGLGLARATRDSDAALLFDLLALALLKKNDSTIAIKRAFETALSLDPFNLAIQHNHERFLAAIEHPDQPVGDGWETSPLPIEEVKQVVYQFVQPTFAQAA